MCLQILIADDHVAVAESFRSRLAEYGWECRVAQSPEAIDAQRNAWTPNVALLDVEFRGSRRTGFDIAAELEISCPDTRIIFLTMHDDSIFLVLARQMGAAGFLVKNVAFAVITEAISVVAGGGTWFREAGTRLPHGLTPRRLEVIRHLDRGLRYREIAKAMHCDERLVRFHIEAAKKATGARTTAELVGIARQRGWLLLPDGWSTARGQLQAR